MPTANRLQLVISVSAWPTTSIKYQEASVGPGEFMKPTNYYPSLEQRINAAISNDFDAHQLDALIAEAERALADAPDPERLRRR